MLERWRTLFLPLACAAIVGACGGSSVTALDAGASDITQPGDGGDDGGDDAAVSDGQGASDGSPGDGGQGMDAAGDGGDGASGDGSLGDGGDGSAADVASDVGCPAGQMACSGVCVSTATDVNNCGACGNGCVLPNAVAGCASGGCTVVACGAGHSDCDGNPVNGCEVDVTSSVGNCGACGHVCTLPNATAACTAGACAVSACTAGYGDCDGNPLNGCETNVNTTPSSCGTCGATCTLPHATAGCAVGACTVTACDPGWADCDGMAANGCERAINTNSDCGACGHACAAGTRCGGSTCASSCPAGTTYCAASGVCANFQTDVLNCGMCGTVCPAVANAAPTCASGGCGFICNPGYADCDGVAANGCEVNLNGSAGNCGACGSACALANATAACTAGRCTVSSCAAGYGDCDGNPANGCEANLNSSATTCGSCGNVCNLPHATASCAAGVCGVASCNTGYGDCDHVAANGCEAALNTNANCGGCGHTCASGTFCSGGACVSSCSMGTTFCPSSGTCVNFTSDLANCGSCGHVCPTPANAAPTCSAGACGYACNPGYGDCDGNPANGCETNLATSATACGVCGHACSLANATAACVAGGCVIAACNPGYGDCDGNPANGCETNLNTTPTACGTCTNACNPPNATASCVGGLCGIAACNAGYGNCDGIASNGCETALNSNTNCGACGFNCSSGTFCSGGVCASSCGMSTMYCGSTMACYNLATDVNNCGACGNICPSAPHSSPICTSGACGITCSAGYGNCDGLTSNGCETNLNTTVTSCGSCGNVCSLPNATSTCVSGACAVGSCNPGYANCDGIASNGCETNLSTSATSCGSCGATCNLANATAGCAAGRCTVASCNTGYGNCDGIASNGCETALDTNRNCGACGTVCSGGQVCSGGACVGSCASGTTYCAASGSCVNLQTNPYDCGSCGNVCPSVPNANTTCMSGGCGFSCVSGYGNCDGIAGNGCETNLYTSVNNCGACGSVCSLPNATPACDLGTCQIATCNRNYANCDGITSNGCEVYLLNSTTNCGACGHVCSAGHICRSGVCL